jgi:hypothetical protein
VRGSSSASPEFARESVTPSLGVTYTSLLPKKGFRARPFSRQQPAQYLLIPSTTFRIDQCLSFRLDISRRLRPALNNSSYPLPSPHSLPLPTSSRLANIQSTALYNHRRVTWESRGKNSTAIVASSRSYSRSLHPPSFVCCWVRAWGAHPSFSSAYSPACYS